MTRYIPEKTKIRVFIRDFGHCRYCGKIPDRLEFDHVVPVARGGKVWGNIVCSCRSCNRSKSAKDWQPLPLTWVQIVLDILLIILLDDWPELR